VNGLDVLIVFIVLLFDFLSYELIKYYKFSFQLRGNDVSLFFVLGKQPFGQFPPSWDIGLEGICVGERRRLTIPPVLAYGNKGLPRRNIPPNSTLQYDISLISINGLANPQ